MSFTDDELRVLKGMTEAGDWPISGKQLKPLIARLEAAEKALEAYVSSEGAVIGGENVLSEWRKAKGGE